MTYPVPPPVNELAAHTRNWLTQVGFPVRDFSVAYGDVPNMPDAYAQAGVVGFGPAGRPGIESLAARYGTRGRLDQGQVRAARQLLHEGLHQMQWGRNPHSGQADGQVHDPGSGPLSWEEGAAEAVARDLLPIYTARLYGHRMPPARVREERDPGDYPHQVKAVRQLSVFGSGAGKWNTRPARVWRRQFLHAEPAVRDQMREQAMAARAEWARRTGR
jgi:hypothetical protein